LNHVQLIEKFCNKNKVQNLKQLPSIVIVSNIKKAARNFLRPLFARKIV